MSRSGGVPVAIGIKPFVDLAKRGGDPSVILLIAGIVVGRGSPLNDLRRTGEPRPGRLGDGRLDGTETARSPRDDCQATGGLGNRRNDRRLQAPHRWSHRHRRCYPDGDGAGRLPLNRGMGPGDRRPRRHRRNDRSGGSTLRRRPERANRRRWRWRKSNRRPVCRQGRLGRHLCSPRQREYCPGPMAEDSFNESDASHLAGFWQRRPASSPVLADRPRLSPPRI